ncbi:hypothetical protein CIPAW_04G111500 [Carya illinoinensis]|uniref:Uncharacterized protein n=1 Tax=Carya illinoinensis TaxID=32201 RepID=A0A8T1QT92_CARIL|nr:hypothetical protein CIPAW_04G111500 [Carya illinoinensis]
MIRRRCSQPRRYVISRQPRSVMVVFSHSSASAAPSSYRRFPPHGFQFLFLLGKSLPPPKFLCVLCILCCKLCFVRD